MIKTVRRSYPPVVSLFVLCFIFLVVSFFTCDIFGISLAYVLNHKRDYVGIVLAGIAAIIALLIVWEELLFPVVIKQSGDTLKVRNHRRKLHTQTIIYIAIPVIFVYIYRNFHVNTMHYLIWAAICTITPLVVKIYSGLKNYNDYLKLSSHEIEYKNNEKEGKFHVRDLSYISMRRDSHNMLTKLTLGMSTSEVTIDLDEMELEAYYEAIEDFTKRTYTNLLK